MTLVYYVLGVLVFAVGLALSIGLHELGHLVPGKLFDVKVSQYFLGFGRTIWSRRHGETEYGVKAVPLGGYVKLVGMLPPNEADTGVEDGAPRVRTGSTGIFGQLMSDARDAEYHDVSPHDHGRLFYEKPWWQRAIIWGCGVTINIVIAFALFAITFMGYGTLHGTTTVGKVYDCVKVVHAGEAAGACTKSDPASPAHQAGLRPGDRVVSFDGTSIEDYGQLQRLIRANDAKPATLVVIRAGKPLALSVSPTVTGLPSLDGGGDVRAGFLGIEPKLVRQRESAGFVVHTMASGTWSTLQTIGALPQKVYHVGRAALGLEKRAADSPMSVVGAGRIAGEMASSHTESPAEKFFSVLLLLAGLNLFLGLVNLVPLPPFDGAGLATSLVDGVRSAFARLLRRPKPKGLDFARLLPLSYAMVVVILVISVVLVVGDVVAPVTVN